MCCFFVGYAHTLIKLPDVWIVDVIRSSMFMYQKNYKYNFIRLLILLPPSSFALSIQFPSILPQAPKTWLSHLRRTTAPRYQ